MREKQTLPGPGFYVTITLVAALAYVLSIGPASWLSSRFGGERFVTAVYRPLTWVFETAKSDMLENGVNWYAGLGAAENWNWARVGHGNFGEPESVEWEWMETAPTHAYFF